jgi:hypothetical protein
LGSFQHDESRACSAFTCKPACKRSAKLGRSHSDGCLRLHLPRLPALGICHCTLPPAHRARIPGPARNIAPAAGLCGPAEASAPTEQPALGTCPLGPKGEADKSRNGPGVALAALRSPGRDSPAGARWPMTGHVAAYQRLRLDRSLARRTAEPLARRAQ